ncbi:YbjN domain-containing protein [Streptomonospora wellingtoniae]|uniref:YbjN domain-containing protein n=1 Tax=Streptomonospora wellingtoniae TaxID=3075544 RepID=A0ABU2KYX8_9ACTN|nr:YbjN domain-containing protein [Streptomonospora sp. DSM 45055]MDT0304506.1 YbjN domain-containing protein [Streptomonospora sp. DSM 45055]
MSSRARADAVAAVETALQESGLDAERPDAESFVVALPGQRKLKTAVWLSVGEHSLLVKTFFCRHPDENQGEFYRWLLQKNDGMYGMAFSADEAGDVYIAGRLPLTGVTPEEVDRLLGCVLTYSDENFNAALERGFASSIRREWEWRYRRGYSMRNLQAFRHLVEEDGSAAG